MVRLRERTQGCNGRWTALTERVGSGFEPRDLTNEHLKQFGVTEMPRVDFQRHLADALSAEADLNLAAPSLPMVMAMLATS